MQFALPPRKTSHPPPYARNSRSSTSRRKQLTNGAFVMLAVFTFLYVVTRALSISPTVEVIPPGTPEIVIVTVLDHDMPKGYVERIKENREDYAKRHGYGTFYPSNRDYELKGAAKSWALVRALRHAITKYPHTTWFFSLSPHAIIMNPELSLQEHVLEKSKLESLMMKDKPIVPPDSVIRTFSHLKVDQIDFIISQDQEGLCPESFLLRRGEWAQFFLDTWFDPLYRSYNFQKAEGHALEHIVQWHPTILTKLALIPQRQINSYTVEIDSKGGAKTTYKPNDFLVRPVGCEKDGQRNCERELDVWYKSWRANKKAKKDTPT